MDDEVDYRALIEKHRVETIKCLDLDRQFIFSYLRSYAVLDDEDCEIILNAGPSRQQKSSKFLDVLAMRGPTAFQYFLQALEIEHGHLYEIFTGEKSTRSRSVSKNSVPWTVLSEKALLDHDRDYLLKEITKLEEQNRSRAYMYSKTMTEKVTLENQLEDLKKELKEKEKKIEIMEEEAKTSSKLVEEPSQFQAFHFTELIKDNSEKANAIIVLQSRLLLITERNERLSNQNEQLLKKNEELMCQIRDLAIKYDFKRMESKRLSKQVSQNSGSIKEASDCKKEIYSLKFKLIQANENTDIAEKKVDELQKIISELKMQQKLVQTERCNEVIIKGQVSANCFRYEEEIHVLKQKNEELNNKIQALKQKIIRLEQEIETHKEEKMFYLNERQQAVCDRDLMHEELLEIRRHNKALQDMKEETMQKQIKMSSQYEKKNNDLNFELDCIREELASKISELNLLKSNNIHKKNTYNEKCDNEVNEYDSNREEPINDLDEQIVNLQKSSRVISQHLRQSINISNIEPSFNLTLSNLCNPDEIYTRLQNPISVAALTLTKMNLKHYSRSYKENQNYYFMCQEDSDSSSKQKVSRT
ncbi:caspase recruitment domain-containing protein 11 isoform X1 [Hydra vulgaris]|uniref:caspase recruitment domain-containing protein 11 isoform X1 n=1 Tax=Hydra vulgaris TaxID=6087 RepID=UPI001F5F28FC|nr:caspase recruitment domain-containing protein 11 [Hydra vulgaris]